MTFTFSLLSRPSSLAPIHFLINGKPMLIPCRLDLSLPPPRLDDTVGLTLAVANRIGPFAEQHAPGPPLPPDCVRYSTLLRVDAFGVGSWLPDA